MNEDMVEKIAQTLYEANAGHVGPMWRELSDPECEPYGAMARAILSVVAASDWTPEMKAAAMADAQKVCDLTDENARLRSLLKQAHGDFETIAAEPMPNESSEHLVATYRKIAAMASERYLINRQK